MKVNKITIITSKYLIYVKSLLTKQNVKLCETVTKYKHCCKFHAPIRYLALPNRDYYFQL